MTVRGRGTNQKAASTATGDAGRNLVHAADHNLRITLEAIRRGGPLGRADLARLTGLSEPGVGNILRQLGDAGLVEGAKGTGRAAGFAVAAEGAFGLGLDMSDETRAEAVLVDLRGEPLLRRTLDASDSGAVRAFAHEVRAFLGSSLGRLAGCGVVPAEGHDASHLAVLRQAFAPLPVILADQAAAAALGELHFGLPASRSFVQLLLGRRVRAGLVIEGRLFEGVHGHAGRIGDMRVDANNTVLDAVAGLETLSDGGFEAWLERAAPPLLDAVVAMAGFLAPATVFVGGPLADGHLHAIAARLAADAAQRMRHPLQPNWLPRIVPATLGADGAAMGAAALAFFNRLLPDPRR